MKKWKNQKYREQFLPAGLCEREIRPGFRSEHRASDSACESVPDGKIASDEEN